MNIAELLPNWRFELLLSALEIQILMERRTVMQ